MRNFIKNNRIVKIIFAILIPLLIFLIHTLSWKKVGGLLSQTHGIPTLTYTDQVITVLTVIELFCAVALVLFLIVLSYRLTRNILKKAYRVTVFVSSIFISIAIVSVGLMIFLFGAGLKFGSCDSVISRVTFEGHEYTILHEVACFVDMDEHINGEKWGLYKIEGNYMTKVGAFEPVFKAIQENYLPLKLDKGGTYCYISEKDTIVPWGEECINGIEELEKIKEEERVVQIEQYQSLQDKEQKEKIEKDINDTYDEMLFGNWVSCDIDMVNGVILSYPESWFSGNFASHSKCEDLEKRIQFLGGSPEYGSVEFYSGDYRMDPSLNYRDVFRAEMRYSPNFLGITSNASLTEIESAISNNFERGETIGLNFDSKYHGISRINDKDYMIYSYFNTNFNEVVQVIGLNLESIQGEIYMKEKGFLELKFEIPKYYTQVDRKFDLVNAFLERLEFTE